MILASEHNLLAASLALGAARVKGWSEAEARLAGGVQPLPRSAAAGLRQEIRSGQDPLGDAFCTLRSPAERRQLGATYTPRDIVRAMVAWARQDSPARVVDPGTGSARFLLEAGRCFPDAELIGYEIDPLAAAIGRANLAALGWGRRARIVLEDYRRARLEPVAGRTLFIGNPPYVRHHQLDAGSKRWLTVEARRRRLPVSQLAGLHVHFLLATSVLARPGDYGVFITSAEWLDVNYGALARALLLNGLGGRSITLLDPRVLAFPDAATTAAITTFHVAAPCGAMILRRVKDVGDLRTLETGHSVSAARLRHEQRWSPLFTTARRSSADLVELGELCRVHRGQVTGCNDVWVAGAHCGDLPPRVLFPAITKARELFSAGDVLRSAEGLRQVVDLPADLAGLEDSERDAVLEFLRYAQARAADRSYIARHRNPWWSVRLHAPAPILATYMARRPPAFVVNEAGVRHLNIAHGIYPREALGTEALRRLAAYLSRMVRLSEGRTYAGGLTKFEPREMERLLVPTPRALVEGCP